MSDQPSDGTRGGFVNAQGIDHALAVLTEHGSDATVLAGGTDIMVEYPRAQRAIDVLLHVRDLPELRGIRMDGARTIVGALTTHYELGMAPAITNVFPSVAEAARTVGGRQTQNVGTIGGNVANASPAADLLPPLLCADARVTMQSPRGQRALALSDFLLGRKQTALGADELVIEFELDAPGPRTGEVYLKASRRGAMEVALAGLAARIELGPTGDVADARIAVCSAGPTAFRAADSEQAIIGSQLDQDAIAEAGQRLARRASPIDDVRATASYRRRVLPRLLGRAIGICHERAQRLESAP